MLIIKVTERNTTLYHLIKDVLRSLHLVTQSGYSDVYAVIKSILYYFELCFAESWFEICRSCENPGPRQSETFITTDYRVS